MKIARVVGRIPQAAAYEGTIKMGDCAWHNGLGYRIPAYTASLDAAMTLVPETQGMSFARVREGRWSVALYNIDVMAGGATRALALCAAALRARAALASTEVAR